MLNFDKRGFLLLEAVLVLGIISVILSLNVQRTRHMREQKRHEVTNRNYEIITCALAAFLSKNNRLPCPASDAASGTETASCLSGYVPCEALGIHHSCAIDGYGKPIFYIPNPDLVVRFSHINYDTEDAALVEDDNRCFCKNIEQSRLKLINKSQLFQNAVIAFALSDVSPEISAGTITVTANEKTCWITRDMLLIRYLRTAPCILLRKSSTPNTSGAAMATSDSDLL